MPHFDASTAELLVHTAREGMLATVGHDLALVATSLTLDVDEAAGTVEARIDPRAIRLRGAVTDGGVALRPLSEADTHKIEAHLRDDVLEVTRFPEIRFTGRVVRGTPSGGHVVEGTLTLHGQACPLTLTTERAGVVESGEVALDQPDFGIKPFRAMLGALRVRGRVVVKVRLRHAPP